VALLVADAGIGDQGSGIRDRGSGIGRDHGARRENRTLTVIKIGGGLLAHPEYFEATLNAVGEMARQRPTLIVPGGGPFADTVRDVDAQLGISEDAAHWMALLAMDQYAHVIAERLGGGAIVRSRTEIESGLAVGSIPVLAPAQWLREVDPLPHDWDVTSDSIAAWVAGQLEAQELLLIKPPGATGPEVVDAQFTKTCPSHIRVVITSADALAEFPART
jgi:aspartokinase-like uncharacterized kinase